jgi:hypothetical protein
VGLCRFQEKKKNTLVQSSKCVNRFENKTTKHDSAVLDETFVVVFVALLLLRAQAAVSRAAVPVVLSVCHGLIWSDVSITSYHY